MKKLILVVMIILASGCSPSPQQSAQAAQAENSKPMDTEDSDRIQVKRLSVIEDGIAYNHYRATYLIIDTETGQEYIGVSGIGIIEVGSHSCGKNCTTTDER